MAKYKDPWDKQIVDVEKVSNLKTGEMIKYYTHSEYNSITWCTDPLNIKVINDAILYDSNNAMKYRNVKLDEYIERRKDRWKVTRHIPSAYEKTDDKNMLEPVKNAKAGIGATVNLHLNIGEYISLLDGAKNKAQELQGIIDKLKNAKVEVVNSDIKNVNITVNCDRKAGAEKVGEYVANKVKETLKDM